MQFHARTLSDYCAITAYLLVVVAIIGAPVKMALRVAGLRVGQMVPAPLIGLALIVVASWYWATPFGGTRPVARGLLVAAVVAVAAVASIARRTGRVREWFVDQDVRSLIGMGVLCFAALVVVFVVEDAQLFTRENFTVLTLGNNDAPSYALLGQHLLDDGAREPGHIANYNAGNRSIGFSGGALSALAGASSVTGIDVWKVMNPMMLLTLTLGAYSLALVIWRLLGRRHPLLAVGAGVAGYSVFYVVYLVSQWFFAQLMGIAFVVCIIGILYEVVRASKRREALAGVLLAGLLLAAGLAIYPHMTAAGTVALLPIVAIAPSAGGAMATVRATFRRGVRTSVLFVGAAAVAAVVVPGLVGDAIQISKDLEETEAGWSLPSIYPSEMLGFQSAATASQGWLTGFVSAALLVALLAAALLIWRSRRDEAAPALVVTMVLVLASYALVYGREGGPTYRQWKWVTFFIPLFVASAVATVGFAIDSIRGRWAQPARQVAPLVFGGYVAVALMFSTGAGFPLRPPAADAYLAVTLDEVNLQHAAALDDISSIHVNALSFWQTMWVAYFLRDHELTLSSPTYYPAAEPRGPWFLERNDRPLAPGAEVTRLNDTYRLVKMPE